MKKKKPKQNTHLYSISICIPLSRTLTGIVTVLSLKHKWFFSFLPFYLKMANTIKISVSIKCNNMNVFAEILMQKNEGRTFLSAHSQIFMDLAPLQSQLEFRRGQRHPIVFSGNLSHVFSGSDPQVVFPLDPESKCRQHTKVFQASGSLNRLPHLVLCSLTCILG